MSASSYYLVEPCTTSNAFEVRLDGKRIDLAKATAILEKEGVVLGSSDVILQGSYHGYPVSIYPSGRIMIRGGKKKLTRQDADELAAEILSFLGQCSAIV